MYAGFWKRCAAAVLDLMIVIVPLSVIGIAAALMTGPRSTATAIADLCALAAFWLYFAGMESSPARATLGKLAFGIRVSDLRGNRVSFSRASARFFGKVFSVLSLGTGFLIAGVTRRRQALHDMAANCLVVTVQALPSDFRRGGYPQPRSTAAIAGLLVAALCVPLAAAGAVAAIPYYQTYLAPALNGGAVQTTASGRAFFSGTSRSRADTPSHITSGQATSTDE